MCVRDDFILKGNQGKDHSSMVSRGLYNDGRYVLLQIGHVGLLVYKFRQVDGDRVEYEDGWMDRSKGKMS